MPLTRDITPETQHLLERIYRHSHHHQVRQRAHCLLLRSQGIKNVALRGIFSVSEKTLYNWFNAWNDRGFVETLWLSSKPQTILSGLKQDGRLWLRLVGKLSHS